MVARDQFGGLWGLQKTQTNPHAPATVPEIVPKSPYNEAKSGTSTMFGQHIRQYWVEFAQTPKIGADPELENCGPFLTKFIQNI